jgi:hypothetical protein
MTTTSNADAIDWQALWQGAYDAYLEAPTTNEGRQAAADYLREKVEAVMVPAEAAEAREKVLREALEWALNDIDCNTRYDNIEQFENAYGCARKALEATRGE